MSAEQPSDASAKRERRLAKHFRWQAFFQRCAEPLFVLDRRRRLLFVNRAWETLTGMTAEQAHVLVCRRSRPVSADDAPEEILAHGLTPPPEVLRGVSGRVRRLLPGRGTPPQWWEVEFLPLLQEGEQGGYLLVGASGPSPLLNESANIPSPRSWSIFGSAALSVSDSMPGPVRYRPCAGL